MEEITMKQLITKKGEIYHGASIGVFDPGKDARLILGEQYDKTFYATACAYLLRRFGPSQGGCDPYKNLTSYRLTTNMDGVALIVTPCCSVSTSFGYLLSEGIYEATAQAMNSDTCDDDIDSCEVRSPVTKALCDAIEELKKPTNVRDWYFNIVGRFNESELEYSEDDDELLGCVEYSNFSGYGISPSYFDKFKTK
jgi:hypothetical protein